MTSNVSQSWFRIEQWFKTHRRSDTPVFPDGASEVSIKKAETTIGIRFPSDLRESYKLHDGSNRLWVCDRGYLMPLFKPRHLPRRQQALFNEVVESWGFMRDMLRKGNFDGFTSHPEGLSGPSGGMSDGFRSLTMNQVTTFVLTWLRRKVVRKIK